MSLPMHPLRTRRRPGPPSADVRPPHEDDLELASRVLELVEQGVLTHEPPHALPVPVDAHGKPQRRLTAEDERALAERIQTCGDVDARNALVLANIGLVHMVARQMRRDSVRYDDLVQEGLLGVLRASETFEPNRNVRFSTYCVYWIRAKIQRHLQHLDRDDSPSISGAPMETLPSGRRRRPRARTMPIDLPFDEQDERSLVDTMLADGGEGPEQFTLRSERERAVIGTLEGICTEMGDPRLKMIVDRRLLADEPLTLGVLGAQMNLSREGARLLEGKVLRLARERLDRFRPDPTAVPS